MKFYTVIDVMEILRIKQTAAYGIIRELNAELEDMGYRTYKGRVSAAYFQKRYGYQAA